MQLLKQALSFGLQVLKHAMIAVHSALAPQAAPWVQQFCLKQLVQAVEFIVMPPQLPGFVPPSCVVPPSWVEAPCTHLRYARASLSQPLRFGLPAVLQPEKLPFVVAHASMSSSAD